MFPAMFIVPETSPACGPPMSMQDAHDGLRVMSAPKIATDNHAAAVSGSWRPSAATSPPADSRKPTIAGRRREAIQHPLRYSRSTSIPLATLPTAPAISGAAEYQPAVTPSRRYVSLKCGNNQLRQKKNVKLLAKYWAINSQMLDETES